MKNTILHLWKNNRFFIVFIFLSIIFRSSLADWNTVPTGSMKPTIVEGDRIWVNKVAYDLKLPFSNINLKTFANPKRGDIVIFESAAAENRLVKRVIGIPGDHIEMLNNTIVLNGKRLTYKLIKTQQHNIILQEKLNTSLHKIQLVGLINNQQANFDEITIPDNFYLVLGDNRNNSADSRYIGLIPRHEIIGRAKHVVMSLNYDNYYLPRMNRFFETL